MPLPRGLQDAGCLGPSRRHSFGLGSRARLAGGGRAARLRVVGPCVQRTLQVQAALVGVWRQPPPCAWQRGLEERGGGRESAGGRKAWSAGGGREGGMGKRARERALTLAPQSL